ncbi:X-element\ORF2 [Symbiodinium sp. CCMP2456]|nr:X-element\ORF2 [Symbiodinium sp. CCMP2456]
MQIDLAKDVPVPSSEPGSPVPKREPEDLLLGPAKRTAANAGSGSGTVTLEMKDLEQLLSQHAERIMQAQHAHLEARLGGLEEVISNRMGGAEVRLDAVENKVDNLEARLEELTKELRERPAGQQRHGPDSRRLTLLFGGWPRDSRRTDILGGLEKALHALDVKKHLDNDPFCTGPRRSTALAAFEHRQGESEAQTKRRMHKIVQAVAENEVKLPGGRRLFATYAKTKEEREIAGHSAWIKRMVADVAPGKLDQLDLEYSSGGAWLGQSFVASAKVPLPPGLHPDDIVWDEDKDSRPWVWISGLAKELGVPGQTIRAIFPLFAWNIGGVSVTDHSQAVADIVGKLPQAQHAKEVSDHLAVLPPTTLPTFLASDLNAELGWGCDEQGTCRATGNNGKTLEFLGQCMGRGLQAVAPPPEDYRTPTSRPRQLHRRGKQIDCVVANAGSPGPLRIYRDSCLSLGTDHELISTTITIQTSMAGRAYVDPEEVKMAFRLERATAGDWMEVRRLRPVQHVGWDVEFAEAQQGKDPHEVIHHHLQGIYTTGLIIPPEPAWEGPIEPFTEDELQWAIGQGKPNKAVGVDGTSHELLKGLVEVPGGRQALLKFYNDVYRDASVPADWNTALMIVIPKELHPTEPGSLRPISMGSAAAKVYSRLLLLRTAPWLQAGEGAQCSGPGKQPAEYLFGMARVMDLEAEWHKGLVAAKIDIRKAFDMVHRPALLARLKQAIGDGPTYRSWHAMLCETDAVLSTGWGQSRLQLDRGIKQGSVESPILFGWLAACILRDTKNACQWHKRPQIYDQLDCQELLFMDDGLIWDGTTKEISRRLQEWADTLKHHGLSLNPRKCKVYMSPYSKDTGQVKVDGVEVPVVAVLEVMGIPFRVGASPSELISSLLSRGRDKFWGHKHLLRANTPLAGRIRLLDKIVGGAALWCLSAIAPDASSLAIINSLQLQCVMWAMKVGKRATEGWLQFKQRAFRGARQVVWNVLGKRWSTIWLERYWNFAGHRARGLYKEVVPSSSKIDNYKNRVWWLNEQRKTRGERHPRHFPKLSNMERDMDQAAGNLPWREVARDRETWKQRLAHWIALMDLPWASGRQLGVQG